MKVRETMMKEMSRFLPLEAPWKLREQTVNINLIVMVYLNPASLPALHQWQAVSLFYWYDMIIGHLSLIIYH